MWSRLSLLSLALSLSLSLIATACDGLRTTGELQSFLSLTATLPYSGDLMGDICLNGDCREVDLDYNARDTVFDGSFFVLEVGWSSSVGFSLLVGEPTPTMHVQLRLRGEDGQTLLDYDEVLQLERIVEGGSGVAFYQLFLDISPEDSGTGGAP